ncbi:B-box zinc finger protein [Archangium lansingense]|uniref:B-box zinc finger protein n=1 Tax=Archangium lansingense TaxID=2995310 RepID=A0ABT3ZY82_9BACT|nr:B-box zinc finger protein [Archangium lansinium]MCY1073657.1 B-box zinc finger protein [Archangium lansinium]
MATAPDLPAFTNPRCPTHQRAAVATCVRCGTFLCGECTELLGEAAYCASCIAFVRRHGAASLALKLTFGLGIVALLTVPLAMLLPMNVVVDMGRATIVFPLLRRLPVLNAIAAGLGFWLSARELRRLERVELSSPARSLARWTRGLAWFNLACVLLQLFLVLRFVLGFFASGQR